MSTRTLKKFMDENSIYACIDESFIYDVSKHLPLHKTNMCKRKLDEPRWTMKTFVSILFIANLFMVRLDFLEVFIVFICTQNQFK